MRLNWAILTITAGLTGCTTDQNDGQTDGGPDAAVLDVGVLDAAFDADCEACDADLVDAAPPAVPCINVMPEALEFGAALQGRQTNRPVRLESCGDVEVEVLSVRFSDDSAVAYTLSADSLEAPFTLAAVNGDAPWRDVIIGFSPQEDQAHAGTLLIETTDPARPRIEVPITGRGTQNECPVAVVSDAGPIVVEPLDIVELDASLSTDADGPGGVPVRYVWTVIRRPDGSTVTPVERFQDPRRPLDTGVADDPTTPRALFFVDLAGTYTLELTVADNLDLEAPSDACPQPAATLTIEARPRTQIHVQLTWNTPGDLDQTDNDGTDVNLHLRHPDGDAWSRAPLDCYYANQNPDWGPVGVVGDPSLDLDDINGAGPENISVDAPEDTDLYDGRPYRIGVEYTRADNFATGGTWGPSEATVRVFIEGVPAGEFVGMLEDTGHFWAVADIVWAPGDRRLVEVNRHTP